MTCLRNAWTGDAALIESAGGLRLRLHLDLHLHLHHES
jgi:hypothetical protein